MSWFWLYVVVLFALKSGRLSDYLILINLGVGSVSTLYCGDGDLKVAGTFIRNRAFGLGGDLFYNLNAFSSAIFGSFSGSFE